MTETPKTPRADRQNLCQSCSATIGTVLAQVRQGKFSANKNQTCRTTLAQPKPLILLGEMHFCANFQDILLRGIENKKLTKIYLKKINNAPARTRARAQYHKARTRALFYKAKFATSSTSTHWRSKA